MFDNMEDLNRYLQSGRSERPDLEYKQGAGWKSLRDKIAQAALAMANLEGGGYIIIGMEEDDHGRYNLAGVDKDDVNTYKKDDISEFINKYADPYVEINMEVFEERIVVIQVSEFEEVPVICKKDSDHLQQGRIYVRSRRKTESTPQPTVSDVREILDRAVDKGIRKQRKRLSSYVPHNDVDPFEEERGAF